MSQYGLNTTREAPVAIFIMLFRVVAAIAVTAVAFEEPTHGVELTRRITPEFSIVLARGVQKSRGPASPQFAVTYALLRQLEKCANFVKLR